MGVGFSLGSWTEAKESGEAILRHCPNRGGANYGSSLLALLLSPTSFSSILHFYRVVSCGSTAAVFYQLAIKLEEFRQERTKSMLFICEESRLLYPTPSEKLQST